MPSDQILLRALNAIEQELGWGSAADWSTADFERLGDRIAEKTGVLLSATTLKRVWGRVVYRSSPSPTTLDALAAYLGYDSWRSYAQSTEARPKEVGVTEEQPTATTPPPSPPGSSTSFSTRTVLAIALGLLLALSVWWAVRAGETGVAERPATPGYTERDSFSFYFEPIAAGIPNSVVFRYDATAARPGDTVFIQQNWDSKRRTAVAANAEVHTSIYYLPGWFNAKLVVGGQTVKSRNLLIPSGGWTVAAMRDPVPVYFPEAETLGGDGLKVTTEQLSAAGISMQPELPRVVFSHVGDFPKIATDDFIFRTRLRHDYALGSAACQTTRVLLLLKNSVIVIPLSRPGCIAEANLYVCGRRIDGGTNDLRGFGTYSDTQDWAELEIVGKEDLVRIYVDGSLAWQAENEDEPREIVGVRYEFAGTGTIGDVSLSGPFDNWRANFVASK